MWPEHASVVLQNLGYLSQIIFTPCLVYVTVKHIMLDGRVDSHILLDTEKFTRIKEDFTTVNRHIGKHDSLISDLQADFRKE